MRWPDGSNPDVPPAHMPFFDGTGDCPRAGLCTLTAH